MAVALPGCSGCQEDPAAKAKREAEEELEAKRKKAEEEEAKKKKEKEKKDDFTFGHLLLQPNENNPGGAVKPGHWIGVSQLMQANRADFQGDATWQSFDSENHPLLISRVPSSFGLRMSRSVSLAHKQQTPKQIEMVLYAPRVQGPIIFNGRLNASTLGAQAALPGASYQYMAPHEYHMLVLAREPLRYRFLRSLDSVSPPDGGEGGNASRYYLVLLPPANKPVPLSTQVSTWTSLAYIVWDDISPNQLSDAQQRAMLDWLHWGGQLIVSGPDTLDALRGSFLAPYLPAEGAGSTTLSNSDLSLLSNTWTISPPKKIGRPLQALNPWAGVKLKPRPEVPGMRVLATTTGDAPLVVEGRVGRGRIVVTGFHLNERELANWRPSFDHFFNACLLRRPGRVFSLGSEEGSKLLVHWLDGPQWRLDPRRVCSLRMFGRDAGYQFTPTEDNTRGLTALQIQQLMLQQQQAGLTPQPPPQPPSASNDAELPPSLGAWDDSSPLPVAAREVIHEASGIEIPSRTFVVWVLAGYLVVLVPLNWGVFRLIGRIEWAWIAAPLIAVAGTALVVRLAQLDIGFVRSVTEVGVLETQPGYARGQLSRFSELYTSLSTGYEFEFSDPSGLIQPFSTGQASRGSSQSPQELEFRRDEKATLSGYRIISNSADQMRSEQFVELGGPILLESKAASAGGVAASPTATAKNGSTFTLRHAIAVRRGAGDGQWDVAWLGDIDPGHSATASYESLMQRDLIIRWEDAASIKLADDRRLSLRRLLAKGVTTDEIAPGDVKLFAAIDTPLPGLTIRPQSNQPRQLTLLVANLVYANAGSPQRDRNSRAEFAVEAPRVQAEEPEPKQGTP